MEKEQEVEWIKAQNIGISVDLVAAAQKQLLFLAAVDRNRFLYEGPALERAIYRYTSCRFGSVLQFLGALDSWAVPVPDPIFCFSFVIF